ncbi:uncharacterized protein LOC118775775 [Megalops cyprinoides]|uniref:uncharacterized protein LOC118775775 n=1 Tax=Megalops cyprinoides TaxID=118141 RepID=UPI001863ECF6|nr:uncharacterized protein LOC118775775 [Megalops cyprinoides]
MSPPNGCETGVYVGLALTLLALLISVCLNIIFYSLRRQNRRRTDLEEFIYPKPHLVISHEEEELPDNQENPIYGNISTERAGNDPEGDSPRVFYEHMKARCREEKPPQQMDVSYASLDLNVGQKGRKKRRNKQNPKRGQNWAGQAQEDFLEVDVEVEATLPSRSSSPIVSRNSIYLNSHQVALETEEREREREWEREWERERERQRERDMVNKMDLDAVHDDPMRFFSRVNQSQAFEPDSQ